MYCIHIINKVKTKTLISCAVIAQLICAFVFAYAEVRFSQDTAQVHLQGRFLPDCNLN